MPCYMANSPFHLVHASVEGVQRVGDPLQLLALVDLFGVGAAHDTEQIGEAELDRAVQVFRLRVVQVAKNAVRSLLCLLGRLSLFLQFLNEQAESFCQSTLGMLCVHRRKRKHIYQIVQIVIRNAAHGGHA